MAQVAGVDGFEQVVHHRVEGEFGGGAVMTAAGEPAEIEVVLGVAERGFGDVAAPTVESCSRGGGDPVGVALRRASGPSAF